MVEAYVNPLLVTALPSELAPAFVNALPSELAPALFKIRAPGHTPPHGVHGESLAPSGIVWAFAKYYAEVSGVALRRG